MSTKRIEVVFNLNDWVKVKLNEQGRKLLYQNYVSLWQGRKPPYAFSLPKEDEEGWSKWQLWSLMGHFGPHVQLGMQAPFDTQMVLITDEKS